ncbi:MAG: sulfite exporter TauE/SafE family protein [Actinobacteria bacterium]|nr:sulfite exporter TauE/SafE family protein [Actinomycetota bacterium]
MLQLLVLGLVGLFAQFIDGSLGMGYGATSASLLLATGVAPALASSTVHLAEVTTTIASGASHWRYGNVDRRLVLLLAVPGGVGAFAGAVLLASLPTAAARPLIAVFLCVLAVVILVRVTRKAPPRAEGSMRPMRRGIALALGLVAGFFDTSGGGGWGSITTSTLLAQRWSVARKVVGSVSASEPVVAIAGSVGFIVMMGWNVINLAWVGALMAGGLIAAPIAAWLVARLPQRPLGALVAGLILFTNSGTLAQAAGAPVSVSIATCALVGLAWLGAMSVVLVRRVPSPQAPLETLESKGR